MKKLFLGLVVSVLFTSTAGAQEHCTKDNKKALCSESIVKEKVEWACKQLSEKGESAIAEIKKLRFDCCGEPNYVWINDMGPKMIMHPIKPQLDGTDLSKNADPAGKLLFVEFVKAVEEKAKRKPAALTTEGSWVEYKWTKLGEADATPKKSWVVGCTPKGKTEKWVVGSGTWY
jgi:methyl-accepting chemotaxis protein